MALAECVPPFRFTPINDTKAVTTKTSLPRASFVVLAEDIYFQLLNCNELIILNICPLSQSPQQFLARSVAYSQSS